MPTDYLAKASEIALQKLEERIKSLENDYANDREWLQDGDFGIDIEKKEYNNKYNNSERIVIIDELIESFIKDFYFLKKTLLDYSAEFDYFAEYESHIDRPRGFINRLDEFISELQTELNYLDELMGKSSAVVAVSGLRLQTEDVKDSRTEILYQFLLGREYEPLKEEKKVKPAKGSFIDRYRDLKKEILKEKKEVEAENLEHIEKPLPKWVVPVVGTVTIGLAVAGFAYSGISINDIVNGTVEMVRSSYQAVTGFLGSPKGAYSSIAAVLAGGSAGFITNYFQNKHADKYPVVFAERERVTKTKAPEILDFYAAVNNFIMYFAQAWNALREGKDDYDRGLRKLREDAQVIFQARDTILLVGEELISRIEGYDKFKDNYAYSDLAESGTISSRIMENAWDYSYTQDYHMEKRYKQVPRKDKDGKIIGYDREFSHWEKVIDWTNHFYTFDSKKAMKSIDLALEILEDSERLYEPNMRGSFVEAMDVHTRTLQEIAGADSDGDGVVSIEEAKQYLNIWIKEAALPNNIQYIRTQLNGLKKWIETNKEDIKGYKRDYSHRTSGDSIRSWKPDEKYNTDKLSDYFGNIRTTEANLLDDIYMAMYGVNILCDQVVDVNSDSQAEERSLDSKDRMMGAMEKIEKMYGESFPNSSLDYKRTVSGLLTATVGTVVGGLAGTGVYHLIASNPSF